jgi:hypothetical protein
LPSGGGGVTGRDGEPRRVPWVGIVGGLALLALVGRGMAGAALGSGPGATPSAPVGAGQAPTPGTDPTGPPDDSASTAPTLTTGAVSTVDPTPPPAVDRVTLALASPSTPTAHPGGPTSPGPGGSIRPVPEPAVVGSPIVGVQSGKCVDVAGGSTADSTRIDLFTCNGGAAQAIRHTAAGELRVLGKCLDAMNQGTADGTPIILYTCKGQQNQKWTLAPDGTIRGVQSNLCLDATAEGTANGTLLELYTCNGGANQAWTR